MVRAKMQSGKVDENHLVDFVLESKNIPNRKIREGRDHYEESHRQKKWNNLDDFNSSVDKKNLPLNMKQPEFSKQLDGWKKIQVIKLFDFISKNQSHKYIGKSCSKTTFYALLLCQWNTLQIAITMYNFQIFRNGFVDFIPIVNCNNKWNSPHKQNLLVRFWNL